MKRFTIGRTAKAAGVNVETVRFYERRGLIEQPARPAGGRPREYDSGTVARIRFIRQAQDIGFSLREITELLSLRADPGADCADVRARAIEKREEVSARLERLSRMRDALDLLIARCPGGGDLRCCTILEAMEGNAGAGDSASFGTATTARKGKSEMKTTTMTIKGMHCDGCARTVEALLDRVPGVRKAEASFDAHQARVLHDQAEAPEADLVAAVAKGGFEAAVERP
ncbi:DNA-binding transcriptional regulator, MerR family [Tistlia consotensis]|uniref:DNA-binding transcriptional regulator, MerR family n=1 Tax=Tistlia consotensis USBA 355 TaxID=560819 RepID=A0A1Y6BS50_9PROT|nr:MerR family DNA-binding protein [Tistlia consotensis]SMF26561.1 DNA-binding transcriptional regulator, MerR family [Tistlia consotensis USBA 355]SNR67019.1 DNA-binding transcriptional regulator, MerR family [Tistlia consotensis]